MKPRHGGWQFQKNYEKILNRVIEYLRSNNGAYVVWNLSKELQISKVIQTRILKEPIFESLALRIGRTAGVNSPTLFFGDYTNKRIIFFRDFPECLYLKLSQILLREKSISNEQVRSIKNYTSS